VKDPGPNLLEQIIKSNELLAAILAGGAPVGVAQTLAGGAVPAQWPILFYWANHQVHPFVLTGGPANFAITVTSLAAEQLSCDNALKLVTDPGGGTGHWAQIAIHLPMTPSLAIRLQVAFAAATTSSCIDWHFNLNRYDLASQHEAEIKLTRTSAEAFYLNSAGAYVSLGTHQFETYGSGWNKLDLVINFATDKYHWVGVNQNAADLSAQAIKTSGAGAWPMFTFYIKITNNCAEEQAVALIDEILITDLLYSGPPA